MAFVEPKPKPGQRTLARAWLVTAGQFEDIVAQERKVPAEAIDVAAVVRAGAVTLGDGAYGTLVCCGSIDGRPLLTCTAPPPGSDPGAPALAPPAAAYLRVVADGLGEAHGLDAAAAARYLCARPGMAGAWRQRDVVRLLDAGDGGPGGTLSAATGR